MSDWTADLRASRDLVQALHERVQTLDALKRRVQAVQDRVERGSTEGERAAAEAVRGRLLAAVERQYGPDARRAMEADLGLEPGPEPVSVRPPMGLYGRDGRWVDDADDRSSFDTTA